MVEPNTQLDINRPQSPAHLQTLLNTGTTSEVDQSGTQLSSTNGCVEPVQHSVYVKLTQLEDILSPLGTNNTEIMDTKENNDKKRDVMMFSNQERIHLRINQSSTERLGKNVKPFQKVSRRRIPLETD